MNLSYCESFGTQKHPTRSSTGTSEVGIKANAPEESHFAAKLKSSLRERKTFDLTAGGHS